MVNLEYHNIKIEKFEGSKQILIKGEVTNHSEQDLSTVAVRIILFDKNVAMVNVVFMVNNLSTTSTKGFEKIIDNADYDQITKNLTRYEVYTDSYY